MSVFDVISNAKLSDWSEFNPFADEDQKLLKSTKKKVKTFLVAAIVAASPVTENFAKEKLNNEFTSSFSMPQSIEYQKKYSNILENIKNFYVSDDYKSLDFDIFENNSTGKYSEIAINNAIPAGSDLINKKYLGSGKYPKDLDVSRMNLVSEVICEFNLNNLIAYVDTNGDLCLDAGARTSYLSFIFEEENTVGMFVARNEESKNSMNVVEFDIWPSKGNLKDFVNQYMIENFQNKKQKSLA